MIGPPAHGSLGGNERKALVASRAMTDQEPLPAQLAIAVDHSDDATIVNVGGEVDLANAETLVEAIRDLPDGTTPVLLGLADVEFIDSSGVRALLQCDQIVSEAGRRFALLAPSVPVARILDLVDLRSRFNEVDAVDGLAALD